MKFRFQLAWALGGGLALAALETLTILSGTGMPRPTPMDLVLLLAWLALPYGAALWLAALAGTLILSGIARVCTPAASFAGTTAGLCLLAWLRDVVRLREAGPTHALLELLLMVVAAAAGSMAGVAARRLGARTGPVARTGHRTAGIVALLVGSIWAGFAVYDFARLASLEPARADTRGTPSAEMKRDRPNIILISIDTLRADHVSCYGYGKRTTPNIDALAGDGVRFALTATTAAFTVPAHASMMTGLFPSSHGATYQYDDPKRFSIRGMNHSYPTLAEILKERGYDTAAFVSCPLTGRQFGFSRGFATFDDRFDRLQTTPALLLSRSILFRGLERAGVFSEKDIDAERRADEVTPPAEAWVRARGGSPAPFFLFVHYYDPHAPYAPPDPFDRRPDSTRIAPAYEGRLLLRGDYTLTPVALDDTLALYDGEIRYVDRYVGNLLRTLKYTGSLDNAVVVLTSDHGESFGEHDHWAHTRVLYEDVLRVPFIVRLPGRAAAGSVVADVIAQPTDILSTVLSVAGLDPPANVEGRDLTRFIGRPPATAGDDVRPRRDVAFAEQMHDADSARRYGSRYARDLTSARTVRWKYIQASTGSEELYDLQNDAGEVSNLASIEPDALHAMRQLVGSWRKSLATIERGAQTDEVDEGTRYRLRGLGYVQ